MLESRYAGVTATATVTEDHRIRLSNGEIFDSPSGAFRRARMLETGENKQINNGWTVWKVADGRTLDELRQVSNNISLRRSFWNGLYRYAATRPDFVAVYGDPSGRKTNSDTWISFGVGSGFCHPDGALNIRDGYITVDLYFIDTLGQFTRNYTQTVKRAADNKRRYAPGWVHSTCLLRGFPKGAAPHLAHDFAEQSVVCYTLCRRCPENTVAAGEGKGI